MKQLVTFICMSRDAAGILLGAHAAQNGRCPLCRGQDDQSAHVMFPCMLYLAASRALSAWEKWEATKTVVVF